MHFFLILLVAASRFLPHPPNVACVGALGLFAGCYLGKRCSWMFPIAALLLSDLVGHVLRIPGMGFYNPATMLCVYLGAVASVPVGRWLQGPRTLLWLPAAAVAASSLFFLISNLGVWMAGWYPPTMSGLIACYTNAIPFFGYTLAGDLTFSITLFGAWEASKRLDFSRPGRPVIATA